MKAYLSLIKFSHTIFALPFAVIGFFLAVYWKGHTFNPMLFLLVIFCMVFARSAAMAFNRYLDRNIDIANPRTAIREIPAGIITPGNALLFTVLSSLLFILCSYFINPVCFYLSPVALFVILGYSFTKRFTWLCHLVLGLGLSLAPIGAYLAVTGTFHWLPLLFSGIVLTWVSGFDIIYALQDDEFDKEHALKSIPSQMGRKNALLISSGLHLICGSLVVVAGMAGNFGIWYWLGAGIFAGLLIYQHTLVSPNNLSRVNMAFFTTNGIASVVFAIFVLCDLLI